ncbi:hypothetical protein ACOALA_05895 [Alicyclobacillus acidoterrestris]|uniref:Transposase n=1 Tax=Alicyclobacillus acidoterrestris (strain ATCC 49025 / DSM 3922 / CIP 106132 / NCIMB 13137 / GD3B) TaxID=1356854 RepID=A0A9E7CXR3_ALIAG|nr:hypothetical protein [Alicyclobacillus acidoterrestris]UNO48276.1 hypothetical protein K1I37_16600 [Alicyclobacillus acidoterrestris]
MHLKANHKTRDSPSDIQAGNFIDCHYYCYNQRSQVCGGFDAYVARKHEIRANVVNRWVSLYKNGGFSIGKTGTGSTNITTDEYQQLVAENKELEKTNEQLKRTLGEQALEVSILRDLLKKANPHLRTK